MVCLNSPPQVVEAVAAATAEVLPRASCVCVFGSFARGTAGAASDVDVAVDIADGEDEPDLLRLGDFAGRIEAAVGRRIDVVLLRGLAERNPPFAYRIADEAVVVSESEPGSFARFKKRAFLQYLDTAHLRRLMDRALRDRVRSGNLGRRNYVSQT